MSAVLHHQPIPTRRPRLYLVADNVSSSQRLPSAVYWRRRALALAVALLAILTMWTVVSTTFSMATGSSAAEPMQTISATQPLADDGVEYWTVRPGDTLWSIAQAITPKGDIRPVLKRLDDRYGSATLVAGQTIVVS